MKRWQADPDLNGVRGTDALAKLPQAERRSWQDLWNDVATLRQAATARADKLRAILQSLKVASVRNGTLTADKREQVHELKMKAGQNYVIDMESGQFDTYLKLLDASGKLLGENDDIAPDNLNLAISAWCLRNRAAMPAFGQPFTAMASMVMTR